MSSIDFVFLVAVTTLAISLAALLGLMFIITPKLDDLLKACGA